MEQSEKKNTNLYEKLKSFPFEYFGVIFIIIILSPILFVTLRDGLGNAVFPVHDQLDETILSYVFGARFFGQKVYPTMMCGIPAAGLKPSSYLFVPLYLVFNVYAAFLIQHCIVIATAFYGMYFCNKKIHNNSLAALLSAFLFAMLPFWSIYGNAVAGIPLFVYCSLCVSEMKRKFSILPYLGAVYFALSSNLVLSGWVALLFLGVFFVVKSITDRKFHLPLFLLGITTTLTYVLCNLDLIGELFSAGSFVSHRVEYGFGAPGGSFFGYFLNLFWKGDAFYEAISNHRFIFVPVLIAVVFLILFKKTRENKNAFIVIAASVLLLSVLYAFFATDFVYNLQHGLKGMLRSFQFTRFYYVVPAAWYLLLGTSLSVIYDAFPKKISAIGYALLAGIFLFGSFVLVKDPDGIFHQNLSQAKNGGAYTGFITMKKLYSENLMEEIEKAIGKDISTYRVVHIGMSPVASLMHGFSTADGYSNNYSLEYKHEFREVMEGELALNDYIRDYYDCWGNRCYIFYHEWGNSYMLGKDFGGSITDLHVNFDKLKEFNCRYLFSAAEIEDCEKYGISYLGTFETQDSYWRVWVYEIPSE